MLVHRPSHAQSLLGHNKVIYGSTCLGEAMGCRLFLVPCWINACSGAAALKCSSPGPTLTWVWWGAMGFRTGLRDTELLESQNLKEKCARTIQQLEGGDKRIKEEKKRKRWVRCMPPLCAQLYMTAGSCEGLCFPASISWFSDPSGVWVNESQLEQAVTVMLLDLMVITRDTLGKQESQAESGSRLNKQIFWQYFLWTFPGRTEVIEKI